MFRHFSQHIHTLIKPDILVSQRITKSGKKTNFFTDYTPLF